MIRAVLFDFGGVLMRTSEPAGRQEWEARLALRSGELEQVVHGSDLWITAQRGELTPDAYWHGVAERLGIDVAELPKLQTDYFRDDRLDADLIALVKTLRAEGYRVGLLSNDAITLEQKLKTLGIYEVFDSVTISAQIGAMKPEPAAFRIAAASLGLSTAECAFIDDNTANVDGARTVGMQAVLYRPGLDVEGALRAILKEYSTPTSAIIFDFGNVLDIAENPEEIRIRRESLAMSYGLTGESLYTLFYVSEPWNAVKVGKITHKEYLDAILSPLGITERAAQRDFDRAYHAGRDKIHPDMLALLKELKQRCRLALLSNAWQRDMDGWVAIEPSIPDIFEVLVSSAAVGLAKPDPAIYHLTLERLNLNPGEALFIDDLERNTVTAEAIGLPCIVFKSPEQVREALKLRGIL